MNMYVNKTIIMITSSTPGGVTSTDAPYDDYTNLYVNAPMTITLVNRTSSYNVTYCSVDYRIYLRFNYNYLNPSVLTNKPLYFK